MCEPAPWFCLRNSLGAPFLYFVMAMKISGTQTVIPAKAGIQEWEVNSRFRRNDELEPELCIKSELLPGRLYVTNIIYGNYTPN